MINTTLEHPPDHYRECQWAKDSVWLQLFMSDLAHNLDPTSKVPYKVCCVLSLGMVKLMARTLQIEEVLTDGAVPDGIHIEPLNIYATVFTDDRVWWTIGLRPMAVMKFDPVTGESPDDLEDELEALLDDFEEEGEDPDEFDNWYKYKSY